MKPGMHRTASLNRSFTGPGFGLWAFLLLCLAAGLARAQTGAGGVALNARSTSGPTAVLTLSVSPPGTGAISPNYNGQPLQIGRRYTITAKPTTGCTFVGWTGSTNSSSKKLAFTMEPGLSYTANFKDTKRPLCVIKSPAARHKLNQAVVTATGKASDNVGVVAVYYQLNANDWALATGTTNWSAPNLAPLPGSNVIRAYAVDAAGNASLTNSIPFISTIVSAGRFTGIYAGQMNDNPSGPGGFALMVDANQQALLIGGDPYNDVNGNPVFASCTVDANGQGQADSNGNAVSFTVGTNGTVDLIVDADAGSGDYPWHWEIPGQLVSSGPFQSVAGAYTGSSGGQTLQGILAPDGWYYSSSPNHGGGGRGLFAAYGQPVVEAALGHSVATLTLNANATIKVSATTSTGNVTLTMKRVDTVP